MMRNNKETQFLNRLDKLIQKEREEENKVPEK
jgi:hypothetical protein